MLKRLAGLLGFFFFWMIGALVFPIFFWVLSGIILTLTIIHVVRAKKFSGGAPFFTGIGVVTALLATGGFFVGGSAVNDAEAALSADAAGDTDEDAVEEEDEDDAEPVGKAGGKLAKAVPVEDDGEAPDGSDTLDVKAALKNATALSKNKKSCKSPETIAAVWKDLSRIPEDGPDHAKAVKAAKILEGCRKQTATALQKTAAAARVKERLAMLKTLKTELTAKGLKGNALPGGKAKEKLTVKLVKATEEQIAELTGGGAVEDGTWLFRLQAAGFAKVTVSSGKLTQSFDLTPTADTANAMAQLETLGLAQPLQMP